MKKDQLIAGDDRAAKSLPNGFLPGDGWAIIGPGLEKIRLRGNAIAVRAKELRPIIGVGDGGQNEKEGKVS